jgi:hypothetical protein
MSDSILKLIEKHARHLYYILSTEPTQNLIILILSQNYQLHSLICVEIIPFLRGKMHVFSINLDAVANI